VVPPAVPVYNGWSITQASAGLTQPLPTGSFNFPLAANASVEHISYVEIPHTPINVGGTFTLTYTVNGVDPVFNCDSPGNLIGAPATIRLFLHQAGDDLSGVGAYQYYRQFSNTAIPLSLGTYTISVPLTTDQWTAVYPPNTDAGFATACANLGSLGFVLGGGYFAGHGVCVTSGSATLTIDSYSVV